MHGEHAATRHRLAGDDSIVGPWPRRAGAPAKAAGTALLRVSGGGGPGG
jgi:hypothetical protein